MSTRHFTITGKSLSAGGDVTVAVDAPSARDAMRIADALELIEPRVRLKIRRDPSPHAKHFVPFLIVAATAFVVCFGLSSMRSLDDSRPPAPAAATTPADATPDFIELTPGLKLGQACIFKGATWRVDRKRSDGWSIKWSAGFDNGADETLRFDLGVAFYDDQGELLATSDWNRVYVSYHTKSEDGVEFVPVAIGERIHEMAVFARDSR